MNDEIRIKRGSALNLALQFTRDEVAMDVGNVTLTAQVRQPDDTLVADLPMVKQTTVGLVTAQVLDTTGWPVGRLRCDLKAVIAGFPVLSETFAISVARQVTRS